jgi:hypothetical protein
MMNHSQTANNLTTTLEDGNISSSEMTAYWRSLYPAHSKDNISKHLASSDGILKAQQFEKKYNYPLVGKKVSVRA